MSKHPKMDKYADEVVILLSGGHLPKLDDEGKDLDIFALSAHDHIGPGCSACGWSFCMHCPRPTVVPPCSGKTLSKEATRMLTSMQQYAPKGRERHDIPMDLVDAYRYRDGCEDPEAQEDISDEEVIRWIVRKALGLDEDEDEED